MLPWVDGFEGGGFGERGHKPVAGFDVGCIR